MTDRPIIFSAPMVRALLAGTKTQTRRVLNPRKGARRAGDRLWVREAWAQPALCPPQYRATSTERIGYWDPRIGPWASPIHMPRWASRLTLIVESVKVERLQDISEDDARAEGVCAFVESLDEVPWGTISQKDRDALVLVTYGSAVNAFAHLWDTLHGPTDNLWVAAYTFRVEKRNIDAA